jgi:hypothetical protein
VSLLAEGGMAELFLARLPGVEGFAREVVIKRVLPSLARDHGFVQMFLEEARLASTLHHQNIVQVHDIGQDEGGYFFAMERLHGVDLGELLRTVCNEAELPLDIALEIARGACAGLHHAHERTGPSGAGLGIVHRDISPQNLFVTFDGGVKLLDFGIAKAVQQSPSHYTRSGTLRGKLPYMSPEQCQGAPIDRRSDVFSLGVVMWEMTVGQRLFGGHGESDFEILKAIVERDAPPPSAKKAGYPARLEAIVMKALQRDRLKRHQTCDELQAELEAFIRAESRWASPRDLAQFMSKHFGERAAAARPTDGGGGELVPFPRPTRPLAPPPTGPTAAADRAALTRTELAPSTPAGAAPAPSRRRAVLLSLAGVAIAAVAIGLGFWLGRSGELGGSEEPAGAPTRARAGQDAGLAAGAASDKPAEDALWFQRDDFLVSSELFDPKNGALYPLVVGKRMGAPDLHGEAEFLTAQGQKLRSRTYWATHLAHVDELVIGRLAFCRPTDSNRTRAAAPRAKRDARESYWLVGLISDISEVRAGQVMVASCLCEIAGVRVPDLP